MSDPFRRPLKIATWLCLIGVLLSAISLYQHTEIKFGLQEGKSFCNISATINCDAVNQSEWAEILGVPIASLGVAFYLSLFILFALSALLPSVFVPQALVRLLALGAVFGTLFSIYLFAISKFVIGAICIVCMGLYAVNLGLLAVAWRALRPKSVLKEALSALGTGLGYFRSCCSSALPDGIGMFRVGVLIVGLCAFCALSLSDFMLVRFLLPARQADQQEQMSNAVLEQWSKSAKQEIAAQDGGALVKDHRRGTDRAPVQIVEFSDFECPACRRTYLELEEVLAKFPADKVSFTFKNFPLDRSCNRFISRDMHRNACFSANFARCAGEQDRFWQAADLLFRNEQLESRASVAEVQASLLGAASSLGLDGAALEECVKSERHMQKIKADIDLGEQLGVEGTPAFWVNGKKLRGATAAVLETLILEQLGSGGR